MFDVVVGRVEFVVGWVPRPGGFQNLGGHSEALEDGVGGRGIVDGGDHSPPTVTRGALLQIDSECPLEKELPREATGDRVKQAIKQPIPVADGQGARSEKDWRERSRGRSRWRLRLGRCERGLR